MSKRNYRSHGLRYQYTAHVQYHTPNSSVSDTGTHMYRAAGHAHRVQRVRRVRSEWTTPVYG